MLLLNLNAKLPKLITKYFLYLIKNLKFLCSTRQIKNTEVFYSVKLKIDLASSILIEQCPSLTICWDQTLLIIHNSILMHIYKLYILAELCPFSWS